jgi:hypothetical protein
MKNDSNSNKKIRQTSLETANEMYKNAFLMKKQRFADLNPSLDEKKIMIMTQEYFYKLDTGNKIK